MRIADRLGRTLLIALAIALAACQQRSPRATLPRHVAHAMGEIEGHVYTNSLEAWRANYAQGCRLFEVDLWMTPDRQLVAFHDGMEAALELSKGFAHRDFLRARIFARYTPLDSDGIARILAEKRDWKIVTDTKSELRPSLELLCDALKRRNVACADRVIPQIYKPEIDLAVVRELGFPQVIFTIYLVHLEDREIVKIARANPRIVAVTMPPARANEKVIRALLDAGVRVYVHTVNDPTMAGPFRRGVWGVYTDSGCRESERTQGHTE